MRIDIFVFVFFIFFFHPARPTPPLLLPGDIKTRRQFEKFKGDPVRSHQRVLLFSRYAPPRLEAPRIATAGVHIITRVIPILY